MLAPYDNDYVAVIGVDGYKGPHGKQGRRGIPGPVGQRGDYAHCVLNPHEKGYLSTSKLISSICDACYSCSQVLCVCSHTWMCSYV